MPTARKLPSGSYRVRVFDYKDEDGTKHYRSFTAPTKKEAERLAASFVSGQHRKAVEMTVGQAMDEYISDRKQSLSPSTISSYMSYRQNYYKPIIKKDINRITQTDIQRCINAETRNLSPKTVRNIHGFLSAVMHTYRPDMPINTSLPQKVKPQLYVPTDDDIKALLKAVAGTYMELPVLLAAFGPMRRGEICALHAEDVDGNVVHVHRNIIKTGRGGKETWVEKSPKSYEGDRYIEFPDFVQQTWEKTGVKTGRFVKVCPDTITKVFPQILKQNGIPQFRFHDLRHYSASIQHALGIPDGYIMQRGGWKSDTVLKQVYRHALDDQTKVMNDKANQHFSEMYDTKYDTK